MFVAELKTKRVKKNKTALINFIVKAKSRLKDFSPDVFYDFLSAIHQRPAMYFGRKSLTDFNNFAYGFRMALNLSKAEFDTGNFYTDFEGFVSKKLNDTLGAHNWCSRILFKAESDEEKAFDLFFALLEEFKLEEESLINDINGWEKASDKDLQKFEKNLEETK